MHRAHGTSRSAGRRFARSDDRRREHVRGASAPRRPPMRSHRRSRSPIGVGRPLRDRCRWPHRHRSTRAPSAMSPRRRPISSDTLAASPRTTDLAAIRRSCASRDPHADARTGDPPDPRADEHPSGGEMVAAEERPLLAEPREQAGDRADESGGGRQPDDGERRSMTTSTGDEESARDEEPHPKDQDRFVERVPGAGDLGSVARLKPSRAHVAGVNSSVAGLQA